MTAKVAAWLTAANLAAGVLNYLFQVHAAAVLDRPAFGTLSAWLAQVTLASSVASVVQFLSLEFPMRRFERLLPVSAVVAAFVFGIHVVVGGRASAFALAASAVIGSVFFHGVVGQLQARLRLGVVAAAVFVAAAARFSLPFWTTFFVAQAGSSYVGIVLAGLVSSRNGPQVRKVSDERRSDVRSRLVRPVLLAFATVLFPQLDVLVLSTTQDAATLGSFSRVALAARIVFFGGAAVLPVLLPHQIHAGETGDAPPRFVSFAERWLGPALVLFVASAILGRPRGPDALESPGLQLSLIHI